MEDCAVYAAPGTWKAPDQDMAFLGLYDGHGGVSLFIIMKYVVPKITLTVIFYSNLLQQVVTW